LCVGKVRATPLKTSAIILNSEILLNLIHTQNEIFGRSISTVFLFLHCAALNSYTYICVGNTIGILTADNLQVAAYALSCLCIPVSNAVVE